MTRRGQTRSVVYRCAGYDSTVTARPARPSWWQFGEHIARVTRALRIPECGGCRRRRTLANRFGALIRALIRAVSRSILDLFRRR